MGYKTERLSCPGCGFPIDIGATTCPAGHPVNISTFNSVKDMPMPLVNKYTSSYRKELAEAPDDKELNAAVAFCYLKLKLYDKALAAFELAIEDNFDNSETFFYAAISLLAGKKPFLMSKPVIDKIQEYINAAIMIEPKGIYYYFLAYIKYDYFERKYFITSPTYREALKMAVDTGLSNYDVAQLFAVLGTERPTVM